MLTSSLIALANLLATQGQVLQLQVPDEPGLVGVHVEWNERRVPFVRQAEAWVTVIGVDLDAEPGQHMATVLKDYADGRQAAVPEIIEVAHVDYPTTELTVAPGFVDLSDENQERAARESREISQIYSTLTPEMLWSEPFEAPIPGAVGGRNFGHRRVFNGQARAPHSGADLRAVTGTPIHAANRGRVVLAKPLFFSGNAVFLDHGLGLYSVYLHLSEIQVSPGELVEKGAVIGLAGATGRVTGPHLHWGVRVLAARVDPFTLLEL